MNNRLTLDYGMRFVHQGAQYDQLGQASNFLPDQWSLAQAPRLYVAGCLGRVALHRQQPRRGEPGDRPEPRLGHARWRSARSCPAPATS